MNNIQKAFKRKGLADGGRIHAAPSMLGTGMASGAASLIAGRPQQIASALSAAGAGAAPVDAPATAPAGFGGMSGIRDGAMPPRGLMLAQRRGMADGGVPKRKPDGGLVRGPGGPTDDKAGLFNLSDEEYVLPADTVDAMGGPEVLDEVRDATHEFVDEENRAGLVNGGSVWEKAKGMAGSALNTGKEKLAGLRAQPAAPVQPAPAGPNGDYSRQQKIDLQRAANGMKPIATPNLPSTQVMSGPQRAFAKIAPAVKTFGTKVAAPLAALAAIDNSAADDSTARYAKRFGVSEPTGDGSAGDILKFAGLRAGGFASDLGNQLTFGAAGKLYSDKPDIGYKSEAVAAPLPAPAPTTAPTAPAQKAPSVVQPEFNTGLRAVSTRVDGKLNSFSGVGKVDPADYQAAVARAEKDKADVVSMAANYAAQGDREGAYRLASGDPAATAAVEQAFQQRGLRQAALNGNKAAAEILAQQGRDASAERVANITADGNERVGLAKARADMAKAQADLIKDERAQRNADRSFGLQERTLGNTEGQQNQKNIQNALEGVLGPRALKDGVPNPAYAEFETKLNETLLQGAAGADGKPRTMQNLSAAELQDFLRAYQLEKESAPGALGKAVNFLTGNSRPESNDLLLNAPRPGTAQEGVLYDTYKDGQGQVRRVGGLAGRDLTVEERRRVGLK